MDHTESGGRKLDRSEQIDVIGICLHDHRRPLQFRIVYQQVHLIRQEGIDDFHFFLTLFLFFDLKKVDIPDEGLFDIIQVILDFSVRKFCSDFIYSPENKGSDRLSIPFFQAFSGLFLDFFHLLEDYLEFAGQLFVFFLQIL